MSGVRELNSAQDFDAIIANNRIALIFYGSAKCGHCKSITPFVAELVTRYPSVAFGHVEVTKVKVEGIDGVPVFVVYKDQKPVDKLVGADQEGLVKLLRQNM